MHPNSGIYNGCSSLRACVASNNIEYKGERIDMDNKRIEELVKKEQLLDTAITIITSNDSYYGKEAMLKLVLGIKESDNKSDAKLEQIKAVIKEEED